VDDIHTDDFTVGLLDLFELSQEVPETALCDNLIVREDTHAVEFWAGLLLSGQVTP